MTLLEEKPVSLGEDNVSRYLQEIRRFPMLTEEQEITLAKRITQGDTEAVKEMVSANLRLVVSVAREYAGRGVALLDLIQEGSIGLLVAARKFDYTLDYRFSTYATKWIRQGVTRCLLNHAGVIRVPLHTADRIRKVLTVKAAMEQESGTPPTAAEIAERTGFSEEKVSQYLLLTPEVCSLDIPTGDEDNTLATLLEDVQAPQPQEELVRRELERTLAALLGNLNDRQRQILKLHFGMEDGICHSLEQIGLKLGISKERARQIEHQAMEKLQAMGASMGLEDFLRD